MALSLPYDISLDGGVNASHVQSNFQTIANKFGTLVAADMPSLTLPTSQLSASSVEEIVTLDYGQVAAGAIIPTSGTGIPIDIVRIPGSGAYTIAGLSYAVTAVTGGGTPGAISINYGTVSAGTFTSAGTILAATNLPALSSGQTASGDYTPLLTAITAPTHLAMLPTTTGATYACRLRITFRLTRGLQ